VRWAALKCLPLALLALAALPASGGAAGFDIPAAVPPQFRSLVRERLQMPAPRGQGEYRFDLETKQSYDLSVIAIGQIVVLEVIRAPGRASADGESPLRSGAITAYVARGTVTPTRIEASFGDLGQVAVRFRPSGRIATTKPRRHCRGADHFTSRLGIFVGNVRFRGEDHYVSVRAHRAKGRIRTPLHLRCAFRFRPPSRRAARPVRELPSFTPTVLGAGHRQALSATELFAFQFGKRTLFLAVTEQSRGSIAEVRYALATAPQKTFSFDEALDRAVLEPPAPFHGKGVYAAAPDGARSWTGPLSASFPGAPRLPLTGPDFEVSLSAGF
jgi:hypothetical protein